MGSDHMSQCRLTGAKLLNNHQESGSRCATAGIRARRMTKLYSGAPGGELGSRRFRPRKSAVGIMNGRDRLDDATKSAAPPSARTGLARKYGCHEDKFPFGRLRIGEIFLCTLLLMNWLTYEFVCCACGEIFTHQGKSHKSCGS